MINNSGGARQSRFSARRLLNPAIGRVDRGSGRRPDFVTVLVAARRTPATRTGIDPEECRGHAGLRPVSSHLYWCVSRSEDLSDVTAGRLDGAYLPVVSMHKLVFWFSVWSERPVPSGASQLPLPANRPQTVCFFSETSVGRKMELLSELD